MAFYHSANKRKDLNWIACNVWIRTVCSLPSKQDVVGKCWVARCPCSARPENYTCEPWKLAAGVVAEKTSLEAFEEHCGSILEASVVDLGLHHLSLELSQVVFESFVTLKAAPKTCEQAGQVQQEQRPRQRARERHSWVWAVGNGEGVSQGSTENDIIMGAGCLWWTWIIIIMMMMVMADYGKKKVSS